MSEGSPPDPALAQLEREGLHRLETLAAKRKRKRRTWFQRQPRVVTPEERIAKTLFAAEGSVVAVTMGLALGPVVLACVIGWVTERIGLGVLVGVFGTVFSGATILLMARPWSKALLARERAWVAGLPFHVDGWFDLISTEPQSGRVRATVHFVKGGPDDQTLRGLAGLIDARFDGASFISPEVDQSYGIDDPAPCNAPYLSWQRRLVSTVLRPLHEAHPVSRLSFEKV